MSEQKGSAGWIEQREGVQAIDLGERIVVEVDEAWLARIKLEAREEGIAIERAAVVAWLDTGTLSERYDDDEERARALERGEHHPEHSGALDRIEQERWEAGYETARSELGVSPDEHYSDALDRVREQVRAETLAACVDWLRVLDNADGPGVRHVYTLHDLAKMLSTADIPGGDALARREAAAYERGLADSPTAEAMAEALPRIEAAAREEGRVAGLAEGAAMRTEAVREREAAAEQRGADKERAAVLAWLLPRCDVGPEALDDIEEGVHASEEGRLMLALSALTGETLTDDDVERLVCGLRHKTPRVRKSVVYSCEGNLSNPVLHEQVTRLAERDTDEDIRRLARDLLSEFAEDLERAKDPS
jgi:hypothetical protein